MTALDSEFVLAYLAGMREVTRSNVVAAVADGLSARIRRGEFDLIEVPA